MTLLIIFIISLVLIFILYTFNILSNKVKQINFAKERLNQHLDSRFKIYQDLIQDVKKIIIYENTILKDIAYYRMQAQAAKNKDNIKNQYTMESKISKLSENIQVFFEQYNLDEKMNNVEHYKSELNLAEKKINDVKKEYNDAIKEYNSIRGLFIFNIAYIILCKLVPHKINNPLQIWK